MTPAPALLTRHTGYSESLGVHVDLALRGERIAQVSFLAAPPAEARADGHPFLVRILRHLETGKEDLRDLPLDLDVSPFDREVLDLLVQIPPGEVVTYGDLARRLGKPGAARAVGGACARNPVLVVVPCHRVVPGAGGLGNYSGAGGADTKRRLLEREGALRDAKGSRQARLPFF